MSKDIKEDHKRFKSILRDYVKRLVRDFPDSAKEDWVSICWNSLKEFHKKFPEQKEREEMLDELEETDRVIREALKKSFEVEIPK